MFKSRYWREYPLFLQVLLLILMMFSLGSFSLVVANMLVPTLTGVPLAELANLNEKSTHQVVNGALLMQFITASCIFLLPALLFSYMTHPRPGHYLGLRKPGKPVQWLLVTLLILGAIPVLLGIDGLFKMFDFGKAINEMQEKNENAFKALLQMPTFGDFLKVFFVMAILPAVSEEMIFRGILMRTLHRRNKRIGISIAITAFTFALVHYNPYGLFAIFAAGVLLGYIYYLTGSLWMSILAHLINNGLQILLIYMGNSNPSLKAFMDSDQLPVWLPISGAVVMAISLWLLWKNRTPLPDNWSEDFTAAELIQREN
jgi:uncharacterized protein